MNRFLVILLGLQRLSFLVPALVSAGSQAYRSPELNLLVLSATIVWNAVMFTLVARQGWFTQWMVCVEFVCVAVVTGVMLLNGPYAQGYGHWDWSSRVTQAAGALVGAVAQSALQLAAALGVLLAIQASAMIATLTPTYGMAPEVVGRLNGLVWYAVIAWFCVKYLRAQGRKLDEATTARLAAEASRAADQARHAMQLAHFRDLHDTVLPTLTALATGAVGQVTPKVRDRCGRDADFVRRLLQDSPGGHDTLHSALGDAIAASEGLGLRVHYRNDPALPDVPSDTAKALGAAAREALNNVVRHAGVTAAWVTASMEEDTVVVRVVDRGEGFDTDRVPYGFGLCQSIIERMAIAGGHAQVTSAPGEGTCVELRWHQ